MKKLLIFLVTTMAAAAFGQVRPKQALSGFLPKGYVVQEQINGDLDKDGVADCVLIIKGTDKRNVIMDEYRGKLDRNRRGIIILFNRNGHYKPALRNIRCFSSENEDGGVYYAPELSVEIKKGNLYISYAHGRYGYWTYTFRYRDADFELIGYDESNDSGPVVKSEVSINFLSRKKLVKVNTNENAEGGDEVFRETWEDVKAGQLFRLSEIADFDAFEADKKED